MCRHRHGFTLVEILIVVLVLGILAAIAIMPFVETEADVQNQRIRHDLHTVREQLELYRYKNSQYPPSLATLVTAGFILKEPEHPSSGSYTYVAASGSITSSVDPTW